MFFAILPMEASGLPGGGGRMPFHNREAFLEESGDYYTACLMRSLDLKANSTTSRMSKSPRGCVNAPPTFVRISAFLLESPTATQSSGSSAALPEEFGTCARCGQRGFSHASASHAHRRLRASYLDSLR